MPANSPYPTGSDGAGPTVRASTCGPTVPHGTLDTG